MADIAIKWSSTSGAVDWGAPPATLGAVLDTNGAALTDETGASIFDGLNFTTPGAGLETGGDLFTAVLLSLFTDAAANDDDIIPDASDNPRGWWGDAGLGSKIWLRMRSKATSTTLTLVQNDIQQALAWMIADGVAVSIGVSTEWIRPGWLGALVEIYRSDGTRTAMNFEWAWKEF